MNTAQPKWKKAMLRLRRIQWPILVSLVLLTGSAGSFVSATISKDDDLQHSVVLRVDSPDRKIDPRDVRIAAEGRRGSIVSVRDASEIPMNVALIIDAGPNQSEVLNREKQVASSLVAELAGRKTEFIAIRAGHQATIIATTSSGPAILSSIHALSAETGEKSQIPIYKAVALAIQELSSRPGIRALMIIAEGNDSGSGISYEQLRASAEAQHVAVMTAVIADHRTRGSKAIFSYGWYLQSLADDTAGVFVDNDRNTPRAVKRLTEAARSLRLVTFQIYGLAPGRHRMHTSSNSTGRLHPQKDVCIGRSNCY